MSMSNTYPRGPLSLCYHLTNTAEVRARFKADPTTVLEEFALSAEAQRIVQRAGDALTTENVAAVVGLIEAEVQERVELMW